ncbi:STAS domain-containing protein [Streptomyces liangshanensis]|uniref:Anti-sigma factor antagonist n=1 Tax=Streptomyces liangshanensis TaxID=2717324 RepID=A0A6G9GRN9_9ACTN|nr:STAS domain-containing protein [Streptomyces liangshanensis]QIQ00923.1 STAS domain-containing protein [Streptomyces liangshanensis]
MNPLGVRTRRSAAGPVLELAGDLAYESAPEVRDLLPTLELEPGQQLLVDLGGLTFCDSSGITVLIAARNHAEAARATLALAAVPPHVARILRLVGLEPILTSYPTPQDATDAWARRADGS